MAKIYLIYESYAKLWLDQLTGYYFGSLLKEIEYLERFNDNFDKGCRIMRISHKNNYIRLC